MIVADRLLAERLQAREQEELTDEEKARLFVELLEKRKKHFTSLRDQEKRNKPRTKAQKKSTMSTYLKNVAGYKQRQLKNKSFAEIQKNDMIEVHFMRFQDMHLFMLVEKRYPLIPATITEMLNKKLQTDHPNEMCYQLLKLMAKQLKK
ncbi:hypothetical protein Tco_1204902 [Tanacetum coccineum]